MVGEDTLVIPLPATPLSLSESSVGVPGWVGAIVSIVTVRPDAATVVLPLPSTVTIEIMLVVAVLPATSTASIEICRAPSLRVAEVIVQLPSASAVVTPLTVAPS